MKALVVIGLKGMHAPLRGSYWEVAILYEVLCLVGAGEPCVITHSHKVCFSFR